VLAEEALPDTIEHEQQALIHWRKYQLIHQTIASVLRYQQVPMISAGMGICSFFPLFSYDTPVAERI
jgi:hypothetical protein